MKKAIIKILNKLPYVRGLYKENLELKRSCSFPHGHFYSPIISYEEIKEREHEIWKTKDVSSFNDINFRVDEQIHLLEKLSTFYEELPYLDPGFKGRYRFENNYYFYADGVILYATLRHFKPRKIIEIGSGFSSALMLDVNEVFFDNKISFTFIEPNPERLFKLLKDEDTQINTVISREVQRVPLVTYKDLKPNDILFIDSSHVVKTGSDVNFIFTEVLPALNKGVLIHFHDIFYSFEYPKDWVYQRLNWNEDYFLRAFLSYNEKFKIELFSHFLQENYKENFEGMPLCAKSKASSLWLRKV